MKTAMVWNIPCPATIGEGAHIGTYPLAAVCGLGVVTWDNASEPPATIHDYDALIVNLFCGMTHVEQIKAAGYRGLVVTLPDEYFEIAFEAHNPAGVGFLRQLQAADVVGYVSESNRAFYKSLVGKPMAYIPHPIGTDLFFETVRQQPKEDFILTQDHTDYFPRWTVQNVAACAEVQRQTGFMVVYVNAHESTKRYAAMVGLNAQFVPYLPYNEYVTLAARARLGVDMYATHGFGRNEITLNYAGTPCIGSGLTAAGACKLDPWGGVDWDDLHLFMSDYQRDYGIEYVRQNYSFAAARARMTDTIERLETWR